MKQKIDSQHFSNAESAPAGGITQARGLLIAWQNGPLSGPQAVLPNGCTPETVVAALIDRLEWLQEHGAMSGQNAAVIRALQNIRSEVSGG